MNEKYFNNLCCAFVGQSFTKEQAEDFVRVIGPLLSEVGVRIMPPVCSECGKPMVNAIDSITKKISKYLWETTCGHLKGKRLSIG